MENVSPVTRASDAEIVNAVAMISSEQRLDCPPLPHVAAESDSSGGILPNSSKVLRRGKWTVFSSAMHFFCNV